MFNFKKFYYNQIFFPGFFSIFFNPFYFAKKELWNNIEKFSRYIKGDVLDVGCGTKPYKDLFSYEEYIGLEIDVSKQNKNKKADVFYNGKKIPFEDEKFDSIVSFQVLEHVFNPNLFLSEINRVLKKNGFFLLTVPFMWDEHEQPFDYARYSSFGIKYLLKKNGFVVIEHKKTLNDIRIIFQLINCYIQKKMRFIVNPILRTFFNFFLIFPVNFLGIIFFKILPKNNDLYLDNIILAQKKNV